MAPHLDELPLEVLIEIFQNLPSTDLYSLSRVCEQFKCIINDSPELWMSVDGRGNAETDERIEWYQQHVHERTHTLKISGPRRHRKVDTVHYMIVFRRFANISVLAIENQSLDGCKISLSMFHETLQELSLRNTFVSNYRHFMQGCADRLVNLRVLIMDRCCWFNSHALIPISKLPNLEIASFYLCKQLNDCDISYISLAGSMGFRKLRVLDVRCTGYGDEILKSFYRNETLVELYFQHYANTYPTESKARYVEILEGAPLKEMCYFNKNIDMFDDTSYDVMRKTFGPQYKVIKRTQYNLTDQGFRLLSYISKNPKDMPVAQSNLYQRPYGPCKCGFDRDNYDKNQKVPVSESGFCNTSLYDIEPARPATSRSQVIKDWQWYGSRGPANEREIRLLSYLSPEIFHYHEIPPRYPRDSLRHVFGLSMSSFNLSLNASNRLHVRISELQQQFAMQQQQANPAKRRRISESSEESTDSDNEEYARAKRSCHVQPVKEDPEDPDAKPGCSKQPEAPNTRRVPDAATLRRENELYRKMLPIVTLRRIITENNGDYVRPPPEMLEIQIGGAGGPAGVQRPPPPMTCLNTISMRGHGSVTDVTLDILSRKMPVLIDVTGTMVTAKGVARFLKYNPDCRVVHETACRCGPEMHF